MFITWELSNKYVVGLLKDSFLYTNYKSNIWQNLPWSQPKERADWHKSDNHDYNNFNNARLGGREVAGSIPVTPTEIKSIGNLTVINAFLFYFLSHIFFDAPNFITKDRLKSPFIMPQHLIL